jgi:hypothetical protein
MFWVTIIRGIGILFDIDCSERVSHLFTIFIFEVVGFLEESANINGVFLIQEDIEIFLGLHGEDPGTIVLDIGYDHENNEGRVLRMRDEGVYYCQESVSGQIGGK